MSKPPAFQFYAKDWLASATVSCMSLHDRGIYIQLLAAAWDSEEPGTLPLPLSIVAKSSHVSITNVRRFCEKWNQCFVQIDGKLVNHKLVAQWAKYKEISEKRRKAAETRYPANAEQMHHSASASAFAFASEVKDSKNNTSSQDHMFGRENAAKAAPRQQLPKTFGLNETMRAFALSRGIDAESEFAAFSDYHRAKGSTMKDWVAAWRMWCRNAVRFKVKGGRNGKPTVGENIAVTIETMQRAFRQTGSH